MAHRCGYRPGRRRIGRFTEPGPDGPNPDHRYHHEIGARAIDAVTSTAATSTRDPANHASPGSHQSHASSRQPRLTPVGVRLFGDGQGSLKF